MLELPVDEKQVKAEQQEDIELKQLAKSPAWEREKKRLLKKIDEYRALDYIDFNSDNATVGEQAKVSRLVAAELSEVINRVDSAKTRKGYHDVEPE
jgi:hypothetical protein